MSESHHSAAYFDKFSPSSHDLWTHWVGARLRRSCGCGSVTPESSGNECFISLRKENNNSMMGMSKFNSSVTANSNKIISAQFPVAFSSKTSGFSGAGHCLSLLETQAKYYWYIADVTAEPCSHMSWKVHEKLTFFTLYFLMGFQGI